MIIAVKYLGPVEGTGIKTRAVSVMSRESAIIYSTSQSIICNANRVQILLIKEHGPSHHSRVIKKLFLQNIKPKEFFKLMDLILWCVFAEMTLVHGRFQLTNQSGQWRIWELFH